MTDNPEHEQVKIALQENRVQLARALGEARAKLAGLPADEALIADVMAEANASREDVVAALRRQSERGLAELDEREADHLTPGPSDSVPEIVGSFRKLLGDES
jgi:hypothetical protein